MYSYVLYVEEQNHSEVNADTLMEYDPDLLQYHLVISQLAAASTFPRVICSALTAWL